MNTVDSGKRDPYLTQHANLLGMWNWFSQRTPRSDVHSASILHRMRNPRLYGASVVETVALVRLGFAVDAKCTCIPAV
jgi:hypothetical protein